MIYSPMFLLLGIEPGVSYLLGKSSTTELLFQPTPPFAFKYWDRSH